MATQKWEDIAHVESVTAPEDGNAKILKGSSILADLQLWEDVFGSVLSSQWNEDNMWGTTPDTKSVTKVSEKLRISVDNASDGNRIWGVASSLTFNGDFNVQVDLDFGYTSGTLMAYLKMINDIDVLDNYFTVFKYKSATLDRIYGRTMVNGTPSTTAVDNTEIGLSFKLIRSGTTLECWYNVGEEFIKVHEYTGATAIGNLRLALFVRTSGAGVGYADFNNYVQNSGGVYWDDSPEVVMFQKAGTKSIFDMSTFAESVTGSGAAKYKYASDKAGTSWNGAWLTEGQMQAQSDVTSKYFKVKAQLNSDGTQDCKLNYVEIDYSPLTHTVKKYEIEKSFIPKDEDLGRVYQELCDKVKNHIEFEAVLTAADVSAGYIDIDISDIGMIINISDVAFVQTSMKDVSESEIVSLTDLSNTGYSYGKVKEENIRVTFGALYAAGDIVSGLISLKQNA